MAAGAANQRVPEPLGKSFRLWRGGHGDELRYLEEFALAGDRNTVLSGGSNTREGSVQKKIFQALHALQVGDLEAAEKLVGELSADRNSESRDLPSVQRREELEGWKDAIDQLSFSTALKSWDQADKRKEILKKLREALPLTIDKHEQDPAFKRRAPAANTSSELQQPEHPSELKAEVAQNLLNMALEKSLEYPRMLSPTAVSALLSSESVVSKLRASSPSVLSELLNHVDTPAIPGLVKAVASDLEDRMGNVVAHYGDRSAHQVLTMEQMRELADLHPPVLGQSKFLSRMTEMLHQVTCGHSREPSLQARISFLTGLQDILDKAPATANWLKVQALGSWLSLQREEGGYARAETLAEFMRLPWRSAPWDRRLLQSSEEDKAQEDALDAAVRLSNLPGLRIGEYTMKDIEAWMTDAIMDPDGSGAELLEGSGLLAGLLPKETAEMIAARAMLLSGKGDAARWSSVFQAAGGDLRALSASTELRFSPNCRRDFMPGDPVKLLADVKNCRSILVKVFEVNAWNYCIDNLKDVSPGIDIEGLGATHSFSIPVPDKEPMVRTRVSADIDQLTGKRGVFVVELLGGGLACRALLRIGRIAAVQDVTVSGHSFSLFWEDGTPVDGARLWVDNTVYRADDGTGAVVVPFAMLDSPKQPAVLGCLSTGMAQITRFHHRVEEYELCASMFMEEEALAPQAQVPLAVWAHLRLHGTQVPMSLLSSVSLAITVVDSEGTQSVHKVDVERHLTAGGELCMTELVVMPEDPVRVTAVLEGQAQLAGRTDLATGKPETSKLAARETWGRGPMRETPFHGVYLSRSPDGYLLSVRGRAGEGVAGAVMELVLFAEPMPRLPIEGLGEGMALTFQTDEHGVVLLGKLEGFSRIRVTLKSTPVTGRNLGWSGSQEFSLESFAACGVPAGRPSTINIRANAPEAVRIPYISPVGVVANVFGEMISCRRSPVLLQITDGRIVSNTLRDVSSMCLRHEPGYVLLHDVPPGLYTLHNLSTQKGSVTVRAVNTLQTCQTKTPCGVSRWLLGAEVAATESELHPLQIVSLEAGAQEGIRAKLSGSDDALSSALVSICITRFVSPKNGEHALGNVLSAKSFPRNRGADALLLPSPSAGELVPERQLSEEVRYVLDRRQAIAERPPCPGSVIRPPSLLIYPQRLQTPWSNDAVARLDRKSKLGVPSERTALECLCPLRSAHDMSGSKEPSNMSMSFVPSPLLICNLVPNEDGEVHVSASDLASYGLDLSVSGHGVVAAVAMTTGHGSASACACIEGACHPKDAPVVPTYPPRPFQPGSKCIEARRVAALKANEVLVVPDPGNLKLRVVDCLPKVWDHLGSLLATDGTSQDAAVWHKLDFLCRWPSLTQLQKLMCLAENPSHELHFFLAVNDNAIFKQAVQPLLESKHPMERSFMDDWLAVCPTTLKTLKDADTRVKANELLCRWGMPGRLMDLNTVERVLFSLLSDSVAAIAAGSSTFVASELRGLHQLFSAKPSRPHGNEHHTKPARRRFTAALRAGGDSRERGRPSEEGPTVLLPPTSMAKTVVMDRQGPLSPRPYGQRPGFAAPGPPPRREIEVADRYGTCMNTMTGGASADEWEEVYAEEERSDRSDGVLVSDEIEEEPAEVQGHDGKEGEQVPESDFLLELLSRRASHKRKFRCPGPTMKFRDAGYLKAEGVHEQLGLAKPCIPPNVFWGDMCLQLAETVEEAAVEPGGGEERALLGSPMVSSNILEALTTHPLQGVVSGLPEISPGASRVSAALFAAGFMAMPGKPSCSLKRDPQTRELTISASSPSLAFIQEMLIVDEGCQAQPSFGLTVIRRLCGGSHSSGEQASLASPLEVGRAYRYEVVVSSALRQSVAVEVLAAVPQGSLPLDGKLSAGAISCNLQAYGSTMIEVGFYFPYPVGSAGQYPVTVASTEGKLLATSPDEPPLEVVSQLPPHVAPSSGGRLAWLELSQGATDDQVLDFLKSGNLSEEEVKIEDIAWRAQRSASFLSSAIAALRKRRIYNRQLWQYALLHGQDEEGIREALSMFPEVVQLVGPGLTSPLLNVEPWEANAFHLELWPLINPRSHPLPESLERVSEFQKHADHSRVFNKDLEMAWGCLLSLIARQPGGPTFQQGLSAAYYLVLQERLYDARAVLSLHGRGDGRALSMQYDYLEAWLALREPTGPPPEKLAGAWEACRSHLSPSSAAAGNLQWRKRWEEMAETLAVLVAAGGQVIPGGVEALARVADHHLQVPPSLSMRPVGEWRLEVTAEGIEAGEIQVEIFPMDAEILFSSSPFTISKQNAEGSLSLGLGKFSIVAPSSTASIPNPGSSVPLEVDIARMLPDMKDSAALMVRLSAGGSSCSLPMYAPGLRARGSPSEGLMYVKQLVKKDDGTLSWVPAVSAYCKVYARHKSGEERFYKDGYTDVLGRFDYASLSDTEHQGGRRRDNISDVAVLVVSDKGCVILKVDPAPGMR